LLDSTPRQIELARLLALPVPRYAHVPLVLGEDGQRLAKRHGAVTLEELSPADARRWMIDSLGLREPLVENFDPDVIPRSPTTLLTSG
jgi:glutamyl-tRNA synthetase